MSFKLPSYKDLNQTQKVLIQLLPKTEKLAVIGGPGTGKTIVGIQGAIQMMNQGKKCLFLSYSDMLRCFIQNIAKENNLDINGIEINTFHTWFWHFIKKELDVEDPTEYQPDRPYFYDVNMLLNLINTCGKSPNELIKYDYIFIDEAQDIQEGMMKVLIKFTKNILVTFDDSQKIGNEYENDSKLSYDHSNILIDLGIGDKFYDLIENYRNTSQIESIAKSFLSSYNENEVSLMKVTSNKQGKRPKLIHNLNNDYKAIVDYIVKHNDKSKSVGVLIGNDDKELGKTVFDILEKEFKKTDVKFLYRYGKRYSNINTSNALSNGIFLMTMKSSKGLEFDEVYLIANNFSIADYQGRNSLYVAFTRAKENSNIIMFDNLEICRELNKMLSDISYMFANEIME